MDLGVYKANRDLAGVASSLVLKNIILQVSPSLHYLTCISIDLY